jgi:hypothetical protein
MVPNIRRFVREAPSARCRTRKAVGDSRMVDYYSAWQRLGLFSTFPAVSAALALVFKCHKEWSATVRAEAIERVRGATHIFDDPAALLVHGDPRANQRRHRVRLER